MNNAYQWQDNVRRIMPYVPGEQPKTSDVIKLNTNENPYPPSPRVRSVIDSFECGRMRLYPDTDSTVLVDELAKRYNVKQSQIFVGVGSDDVLSVAFLTFFNSTKPILFPDITYSFYDVWAELYKIPYKVCPLDENFRIISDDYLCDNGGIVIANPNAPTGVLESVDTLERIIMANPSSVVIVDEAYIDFGGQSCMELIDKYDNLLVVQTFSKSRSMAGMRIGFAVGCEKLIASLNDVKFSINSYTMNVMTQICGAEAVKDDEYFRSMNNKIIETREYSKERLAQLGFDFTDSMSNFIFASHKKVPASLIFSKLKEKNIYVRYWNKPRIANRLRITVGTKEEMDALFAALADIVER